MTDPGATTRRLEAFFEGYYRAFCAGEYRRIARDMYRPPAVMATAEGVDTLESPDQILAMFEKTGAALVADGYAKSELLACEISVLSASAAVAATRFRRVRRDGSVIVEAGATYTLFCEDGWRIGAAMLHDVDRLVSLSGVAGAADLASGGRPGAKTSTGASKPRVA